jgi:hypothetical protein
MAWPSTTAYARLRERRWKWHDQSRLVMEPVVVSNLRPGRGGAATLRRLPHLLQHAPKASRREVGGGDGYSPQVAAPSFMTR